MCSAKCCVDALRPSDRADIHRIRLEWWLQAPVPQRSWANLSLAERVTLAHNVSVDLPTALHSSVEKNLKPINGLAFLFLLATPAFSQDWTCSVAYDEVNGGGTFAIGDEAMTFVSNWPHRRPETLKCLRVALTSECLGARLSSAKNEGASAFFRLYSIVWEPEGGPQSVTIRQASAIFAKRNDAFELSEAFPSIGYNLPVTDCEPN